MSGTFLVIDVGSTSIKGAIFDRDGTMLAKSYRRFPETRSSAGDGAGEVSAREVLSRIRSLAGGLTARLDAPSGRPASSGGNGRRGALEGAVLTGQMGSLLWVDGATHSDVLPWQDGRDRAERVELLSRLDPDAYYQRTGQRVPHLAARAAWGRKRYAGVPIPLREWLIWRATGTWAVDPTDASVSGCLALAEVAWDERLAGELEVDPRSLLPLRSCNAVVGETSGKGAGLLGIPAGTPLVLGAGDGPSSSLGAGATEPDVACVTLGSSGTVRVTVDRPLLDPHRAATALAFLPASWLVSIPLNNVGIALEWGRRALGFADLDSFSAAAAAGRTESGLAFLPYLGGERYPYWDVSLTGTFSGLRLDHDRDDLATAIVLGIAFTVRRAIEYAGSLGLELRTLHLNGGAVSCLPLVDAIAALSGLEVRVAAGASIEGALQFVASAGEFDLSLPAPALGEVVTPTYGSGQLDGGYVRFLELAPARDT